MIRGILGGVVGLIIGSVFMVSCKSDEGLPVYDNPNLTDTSGQVILVDLFISLEIEGVPYSFYNGTDDYTNWSLTSEEGFCGGGTDRFVQVHSTTFFNPAALNQSFYIDFRGCLNSDSITDQNRVDSVMRVGLYPYYPNEIEHRSVTIRYIDANGEFWSSSFNDNTSSSSSFELSSLTDNAYDVHSKHFAYGKFEGFLYNSSGDAIKIKKGQFKGRIVN